MRVHRLEMTAFGPFAEPQAVDFEPLNAAGVFLLTGETGAGKTSVLDAICFGLYGQVPGMRDKAKAYRSDHAPPEVAPRVVLEVTLQGRRFRLTRTPPWSRPSRRARAGRVEQKASATAEELVDGSWVAVSSRVDEVGHLVTRLLGLNREQFCQVVLLPQGDFQAFLRAGAKDRQQILETLFGTQRYLAVERWLAEHRRVQGRVCRRREEEVERLLARLQEACVPPLVGLARDLADLTATDADLRSSVQAAARLAGESVSGSRGRADDAEALAKEAQHALDAARVLIDQRQRHAGAVRQLAALQALHGVAIERERVIKHARAAAVLAPLLDALRDSELSHEQLRGRAADAARRALELGVLHGPGPARADLVRAASTELSRRRTRLESLAALDAACRTLGDRIEQATEQQVDLVARVAPLTERLAARPGRLAELRTELDAVETLVRSGLAAAKDRAQATTAAQAARDVAACDLRLDALHQEHGSAREAASAAAEQWLDAREHRLAGMAAELAGWLVDGDGCPVCGSTSHPAPAQPAEQQVTAEDERVLHEQSATARRRVDELELTIRDALTARAAAAARTGGLDLSTANTWLGELDQQIAAGKGADAAKARLIAEVDAHVVGTLAQETAQQQACTSLARVEERLAEWRDQLQLGLATLAEEVGPGKVLGDEVAATEAGVAVLDRLAEALQAHEESRRSRRSARRALAAALHESPFDDREQAMAARLTPAEIDNQETLHRTWHAEVAHWSRQVADPVLAAAAAQPEPELDSLSLRATTADRAAGVARSLADAVERRHARMVELSEQLDRQLAELTPLRAARDLADDVASLCAGTSPDNATRTALSHYVLGARLGQVVAAANLRLESVGGGRYQLEHTMVRGAGDTRGGLGLLVRDTHTDRVRDPATLSGGETFYVSLALALGLADVVTGEAGDVELSTLFVDEGFGSLDDDTRDEVLDELDALRSGGRSVGLVSHLVELRARCPVRLQVVAGPGGSRCLPVTAG